MQAAQIAADVAAAALSATMGMDPALPPSLPGFIMLGAPNVLIAGAPFPNTADFADAVFKKLKALAKKAKDKGAKRPGRVGKLFGGCGCPG
jgi:hypothetical protein